MAALEDVDGQVVSSVPRLRKRDGCPIQERDGCAVRTAQLAPLIREFTDTWLQQRRPMQPVGAVDYLSKRTGLARNTLITYRAAPADRPFVELRVADRIVTAIGREESLYDGSLEVVPNPKASAKARASCCASARPVFEPWSLTGVA